MTQEELESEYAKADGAYANETMYYHLYQLRKEAMTGASSKDSNSKEVHLTRDQLMTCSHFVRGYSLKLKAWSKSGLIPVAMIMWVL